MLQQYACIASEADDLKIGTFRSASGREAYVRAYDAAMADLPAPSASRDVPTSLGSVRAYEWTGTAPHREPVVLLPGRSSGVPMWGENLPGFRATGRTIIAFDAIGDAGMSVQTAPLRGPQDQARWVEEALEGLHASRVHTVGHSFGGATAAAHALYHPERLASLTLLEPVFILHRPPLSTLFWATIASLPVPSSWRDHALAAIGGLDVDQVREQTPIGDMIAAGTAHFAAALPTPRTFSDNDLARLTMPTYVAIAARASLAGGEAAAARAREIPHAEVDVWPNTTHSLPMQVAPALGKRLGAFWDHC